MADKAYIEVEEPSTQNIEVMFNPNSYKYGTTSNFSNVEDSRTSEEKDTDKEKRTSYRYQYNGTKKDDFEVELFFDTYEKKENVSTYVDEIVNLTMPTIDIGSKKRPPICSFIWGTFKYRGFISSVGVDYIMFLANGDPVRATVTVKFIAKYSPKEKKEWLGSEACRKIWRVKTTDRLDLIASQVYKDSSKWIFIAKTNNISNPVKFPSTNDIGRELILPDIVF